MEHIDWTSNYKAVREAVGIKAPGIVNKYSFIPTSPISIRVAPYIRSSLISGIQFDIWSDGAKDGQISDNMKKSERNSPI